MKTIGVILVVIGLGGISMGLSSCRRYVPTGNAETDIALFNTSEHFAYFAGGGALVASFGAFLYGRKGKNP